MSLTLYFGFQTGGQIVYGMEFLTVYPDYQCYEGGEWITCDRQTDICDAGLSADLWRIDYESENSFRNWVDPDKLNLTCVPGYMIGLMGSAYFLGFAISSGITPTIGDRYGRKKPYTISLFVQTCAYALIISSKDIRATIGSYFLVGLCAGGRDVIGAMYQAEFMPEKYHVIAMTGVNCVDATAMIF